MDFNEDMYGSYFVDSVFVICVFVIVKQKNVCL